MVRRRQRVAKTAATNLKTENLLNSKTFINGHLQEEQYFASPKRKDCKIEAANQGNIVKMKQERIIGVPLATRSQTRTIENFFKASAKLKANAGATNGENCFYNLCEDDETTNDTDNTDCSDEATLRYDFQECAEPNACNNIFLQEPVLKLKVEENLPSTPLSKGLKLEPIFSSPSSLNGRFDKIVSITIPNANMLPDNDNSSCDSGVAFSAHSLDNNTPPHAATYVASPLPPNHCLNRRRKPTTPHRIVCPSPVKSMPVLVSPMPQKPHENLSPRKTQRQQLVTNNTSPSTYTAANKYRRRLNHQATHGQDNKYVTKSLLNHLDSTTSTQIHVQV